MIPVQANNGAPASKGEAEISEEVDVDGSGTGLEVEKESENDGDIKAPFDPTKIDVITQQRTIDLLLSRLEHGELNLSPDFQRRANLWSVERKSGLIESILLRIPIPSLYISEDHEGNYHVVDGLQRLCAIAHFVSVKSLNSALETRLPPLRLRGLQSLGNELVGAAFDELARPLQRRISETELTLHIIRAGTPANVKFNIFSRINQGGLPLTAQEIRNAIYPGIWKDSVRRMATSVDFRKATEERIKSTRLESHELVLRFASHYALPRGEKRPSEENLDDFLNTFVEKRSAHWDISQWAEIEQSLSRALVAAPKIFGRLAFRKFSHPHESRRPINRGLFEAETVSLARRTDNELKTLVERSEIVIEKYKNKFSLDPIFTGALLYATGRGNASNKRIETISEILDEALNA